MTSPVRVIALHTLLNPVSLVKSLSSISVFSNYSCIGYRLATFKVRLVTSYLGFD